MMARPKIEINWEQVNQMCGIQCTGEEIASVLGVSYDTLQRRCEEEHNMGFAEYFRLKGAAGKASLRRKQYQTAMDGNVTMLIWLGKTWLNQADRIDHLSSDASMSSPKTIRLIAKEVPVDAEFEEYEGSNDTLTAQIN